MNKQLYLIIAMGNRMSLQIASNAKHRIVEIGRARGGSTLLFSISNSSKVNIFSINICNAYDEYLNALFRVLKCSQNLNLMVDDANQVHKTQ